MRTTASITDSTENFTSKAARNKDWYCEQGIKQQRLIWHRGMDTEFEWQKIKADKKMTRLFSIVVFTRLKRSSSFRGKMIQKWSEGKQKLLSSWREVWVIWSQLYFIVFCNTRKICEKLYQTKIFLHQGEVSMHCPC